MATFAPNADLAYGTVYTATITTGATDQANPANPLAANYAWTFTTVSAPTPPTVISTVPANRATNVPVNQALSATFNGTMSSSTIRPATFTVTGPGGLAVSGTVTYAASVATFSPAVESCLQHPLYRHDYHRSNQLGRHPAGRQLCLELYNDCTAARGCLYHPREWGHRRAHQPGTQCNLQRGHELRNSAFSCKKLYRYRSRRRDHSRNGGLRRQRCYLCSGCSACDQHPVYSDDHQRSAELSRWCAGQQLPVDVQDRACSWPCLPSSPPYPPMALQACPPTRSSVWPSVRQ